MSVEEIPAFSMWKMFSDTIPALLKTEFSESSIKRLANIIKLKEFPSIFVYNRDPTLTFDEYEIIVRKYKFFSTWLLGRFFHLLTCPKLKLIHDVIIQAQIRILDELFKTHLHVYAELVNEYGNALNYLTEFTKQTDNQCTKFMLEVFIPGNDADLMEKLNLNSVSIQVDSSNCYQILSKLLKVIRFILERNAMFNNFDRNSIRNLDNLLHLLANCCFLIKFEVLDIYLKILKGFRANKQNSSMISRMDLFSEYFENAVYEIYNEKAVKQVGKEELNKFEDLLIKFLELSDNVKQLTKISLFVCMKNSNNHMIPSEQVQKRCSKFIESSTNDEILIRSVLRDNNPACVDILKNIFTKDLNKYSQTKENLKICDVSSCNDREMLGSWSLFLQLFQNKLQTINCTSDCQFSNLLKDINKLSKILIQINVESKIAYKFFNEPKLFFEILTKFSNHSNDCSQTISVELLYEFFVNFLLICNETKNFDIIFNILAYPFVNSLIDQRMFNNFIGGNDCGAYKQLINNLYQYLSQQNVDKVTSMEYLRKFFVIISSGLIEDLNPTHMKEIERIFMKILQDNFSNENLQSLILEILPHILTIFEDTDGIITNLLTPASMSKNPSILQIVTTILPDLICLTLTNFQKHIYYTNEIKIRIYCDKYSKSNPAICKTIKFLKINLDLSKLVGLALNSLLKYLTSDHLDLKLQVLNILPRFSNHVIKFHSVNVTKIWIECCGHNEKSVRRKFAEIVLPIIRYEQDSTELSEEIKNENIDILLETILKLTKKSLQYSNYDLQETLLYTIQKLCYIQSERIVLPIIRILLYLIMIPTSKHSLIAVNNFFELAESRKTTAKLLFEQYRQEMCEIIVHLCSANLILINKNLLSSLDKISVTLDYYSSKDFVSRECQYLLPFFVAKINQMDDVKQLIEEMALITEQELSELLASKYGYIFLRIFLNETKSDLKKCMEYLEATTSLSGPLLRKRNLRIILNELLLHFHTKRDKVLLALTLLVEEDIDNCTNNIQDYLQSRFLGLLQHFDLKLTTKNIKNKIEVINSLADLFQFMGAKHLGPLRFKIIAMLRTIPINNYPNLVCNVWDSFVHSCEIEALAPQLVTITVSLIPLLEHCPDKVNNIFKYLIVQNEENTKEFIQDLFFINDNRIDSSVIVMIEKYLKKNSNCNLKEKIQLFLKYFVHETLEVRIESMKHLKLLMEKNREELDQMILGYNGIDSTIVELIDILMLACREKDESLRLIYADVIGELGAVEPSHLPRRYAQNSKLFTFYINDDAFISNALNELTKALQGEKNTHNMDRFSLAIQEILKTNEISPDEISSKHNLWEQFPEAQREVMLPLLSSKYIINQPITTDFPSPIYGTSHGASFQSWLYNWNCNLIQTLPEEHKSLLTACLPAMKQSHRILMNFLPHILLHSLLDVNNTERIFTEINTVISSYNNKVKLTNESLDIRPFPTSNMKPILERMTPDEVKQIQCMKIIFILLDFIDRWIREWEWKKGLKPRDEIKFHSNLKKFLSRFSKLELAKCSYHCSEYPRALMYLEDYIVDNSDNAPNTYLLLTEIYAKLDEPDGVAGVIALQRTEPTIEQKILSFELSGKLSDAAACYESIKPPLKMEYLNGLMQCYLDLDYANTTLNFARGAIEQELFYDEKVLLEGQAVALWHLSQYDELDPLLKRNELIDSNNWGVQIGRALLSFQNGERDNFKTILEKLKSLQIQSLGATSLEEGSYQHGYDYISKLHALNELQQVEEATYELLLKPNDNNFVGNIIQNLKNEWDLRIKVVQESVRIIEPLLCLRRAALNMSKNVINNQAPGAVTNINTLLGECWLLSSKTARAAGLHQQAYTYTIKAEEYAPERLFLEKAELYWLREEHEQALNTLRMGLETIVGSSVVNKQMLITLPLEKKKLYAEAKLLIAIYNDSLSNVDVEMNISNHKEAVEVYREWEKSLVLLGQFYDKIFQNFNDEDRDTKGSEIQIHMINYFGKSLQYGTNYVYQSLPRMLSIWFDYGTRLLDTPTTGIKEERKNNLLKMTKLMDSFSERLPGFIFLTAFSQLVSRICHPQKEVYIELSSIIIKLILQYPQQTLWMMISVIKSSYLVRSKRCAEILKDPRLKIPSIAKLIQDFTTLAEKLIELCNKDVPGNVNTVTVSSLSRGLLRLLNKKDLSEIMIPTFKFRKLILPNPDFKTSQHNPFPNFYVHIVGIQEEVTILHSLQKPRKITFIGSDGKSYIQMLKPKDDLRKDFRLMEFNDIVNQLLSREPEARQRRLNIRLYSVVPLNEECGLIEWVPNLVCLRPVLMALHKQKGCGMTARELKEATCTINDPLVKKRDAFTKQLLPRHPPVLNEWFKKTFPDAQSWINARTAYTHTTAVISMVGYILGLGDRHGENILLDSVCGDTVHVDFNCLFNKGEQFEWPERVPFRLTQNMVSAMGPLGVEGLFRKSCACTLKVLRENSNTLMSIVTPFVYDPLVSWPKNIPSPHTQNAERTNEQAVDHIKNIKLRLQGIIKNRTRVLSIPLSVEGQSNHLISEAMSVDNLCQMYIGWGPYL